MHCPSAREVKVPVNRGHAQLITCDSWYTNEMVWYNGSAAHMLWRWRFGRGLQAPARAPHRISANQGGHDIDDVNSFAECVQIGYDTCLAYLERLAAACCFTAARRVCCVCGQTQPEMCSSATGRTLAMSWLPFRRTFLDLRSLCSTCSGCTQHGMILTVLCRCCHILSCNELKLDTANSRCRTTPEAA